MEKVKLRIWSMRGTSGNHIYLRLIVNYYYANLFPEYEKNNYLSAYSSLQVFISSVRQIFLTDFSNLVAKIMFARVDGTDSF